MQTQTAASVSTVQHIGTFGIGWIIKLAGLVAERDAVAGMGMRSAMCDLSSGIYLLIVIFVPFHSLQEREVGKLLYQGLLHVSEPKFGIKAEKERQVFVFETALVFARKVDLGQAKFKYEYKFKLPVSLCKPESAD